jgi:hypothetical protein
MMPSEFALMAKMSDNFEFLYQNVLRCYSRALVKFGWKTGGIKFRETTDPFKLSRSVGTVGKIPTKML